LHGKGKRQHFYFSMFLAFLALAGLRLKGNKHLMQRTKNIAYLVNFLAQQAKHRCGVLAKNA